MVTGKRCAEADVAGSFAQQRLGDCWIDSRSAVDAADLSCNFAAVGELHEGGRLYVNASFIVLTLVVKVMRLRLLQC